MAARHGDAPVAPERKAMPLMIGVLTSAATAGPAARVAAARMRPPVRRARRAGAPVVARFLSIPELRLGPPAAGDPGRAAQGGYRLNANIMAVNSTIRRNSPRAPASAAGGAAHGRDPDQPAVVRPGTASAHPSSAASARRARAGLRSCLRAPSGNGGNRPKVTVIGREAAPPGPPGGWGGGGPG